MTASPRVHLAFVVAVFGASSALLVGPLGVSWKDTGLAPLVSFFEGRQGSDSWVSMEKAWDYVASTERRGRTLYEKMFFSRTLQHKGFQYPPMALLPVDAAVAIGGASRRRVLEVFTWLWIPATAALVFLLDRRLSSAGTASGRRVERAALAVVATLAFYPVMRAYANGQAQTWVNGLFAAAALSWAAGRQATTGALVAGMCLVKPQAGILAVWALLRHRRRFLAGFAAVALPAVALSITRAGLAAHLEYLQVLGFLSRHGESFFPNQSVNGLLNRLLGNGENLAFFPRGTTLWMDHFPPYHRLVHLGTMLSSGVLLAAALWPPRQRRARGGDVDFMLAELAATMASPIAWEHHYGVLLPMFVVARHALARDPVRARWTSWALGASWILTGTCGWVTRRLAEDGAWNVLQSYVLFGGLLLFALLWKLREGPALAGAGVIESGQATPGDHQRSSTIRTALFAKPVRSHGAAASAEKPSAPYSWTTDSSMARCVTP